MSCALLLERDGYSLDRAESTRRCLKYRRGTGKVMIVNHDGQGWWDPMSQAKGDVFSLAQHLDPGLNFGQVRKMLRGLVGMTPAFPEAERRREERKPAVPVAQRWEKRRRPSRSSATWTYSRPRAGCPRACCKRLTCSTPCAKGRAAAPGSRIATMRAR